jgi:hypothetical protein
MNRLFVLACLLPAGAAAQTPACDALQLEGVWLDPFDTSLVRVLVANPTFAEFSYPSWTLRDAAGTVWASEAVTYFGIAEESFHALERMPELPGGSGLPAVLDLYTGFGEVLDCTFDAVWTPRTFSYAGTGPEGCLPVKVRMSAFGVDSPVELAWSLTELGETTPVAAGEVVLDASNVWTVWGEEVCLDQTRCYTLSFATPSANIELAYALGDPERLDALIHWIRFGYADPDVPLTNTYALDLYGGDCPVVGVPEVAAAPVLYPNPGTADGFTVAGLPTDRIVVFDAAGRRIHDGQLGTGAVDAANWLPGVYHVLRCNGSSCGAARWIRQ